MSNVNPFLHIASAKVPPRLEALRAFREAAERLSWNVIGVTVTPASSNEVLNFTFEYNTLYKETYRSHLVTDGVRRRGDDRWSSSVVGGTYAIKVTEEGDHILSLDFWLRPGFDADGLLKYVEALSRRERRARDW